LDFLHFSSEDDLRRDFIRFFKNGNWLEAYVFLMLERAGCSTRLLNVRISKNEVSLEADILALFKNKLFIFEVKDRSASNGLTENDITNIGNQLERMANIGSSNIETTYVINIGEEFKTATKSTIDELSSTKGVNVAVIFLENHQAVDSVVANIRGSLR
jgi:Holliday junction resolvase-like predicted endonuclease